MVAGNPRLLGKNAPDMSKLMRINLSLYIENTFLIKMIYSYTAGGMNDLVFIQQNTYVHDFTLCIFKEGQVSRLGIMIRFNRFSLIALLPGVTKQTIAANLKYHLSKSRAINTKWTFASPHIRRIDVFDGCIF